MQAFLGSLQAAGEAWQASGKEKAAHSFQHTHAVLICESTGLSKYFTLIHYSAELCGVLSQTAILDSEQHATVCSQCWAAVSVGLSGFRVSYVRHCLPFVLDHLFKDVCTEKSLKRQSLCLPPEQGAGLLIMHYAVKEPQKES